MSGFDDPFLQDALLPPTVAVAQEPAPSSVGADEQDVLPSLPQIASNLSASGIRRPLPKRPGFQVPTQISSIPKPTAIAEPKSPPPGANASVVPEVSEKPFEDLRATFATAEPMGAGEFLCLIPADVGNGGGMSLGPEMKGSLRGEIRLWVDGLRKRNTTAAGQLRSLSPRDDAIDLLANRLVEQASKSRTGVWTTALPTGRQLALVRQDVFKAVGLDQLVRFIHYQAIKVAMANGDPYSQHALDAYEMSHPEMSAVGSVR